MSLPYTMEITVTEYPDGPVVWWYLNGAQDEESLRAAMVALGQDEEWIDEVFPKVANQENEA